LRSQPPDQRPVLQSDHSPIVECSLFTAETDQFSSVVDMREGAAGSEVSLSTVTQFGEEMGQTAIDLLMERIRSGRTAARHRQLQPELRVRSSSRRARPERS
ncbi:substrate-binding domain-containing protein, partial [Microbacterium sp. 2FI]|uniref:substrate-binding domain-containing protein n=1 Tax=Microbacterium sp. 2FI TaxID=2502193 RepID=UPI001BB1CF5A